MRTWKWILAGVLTCSVLLTGCQDRSKGDASDAGSDAASSGNSDTVDLIVDGVMQAKIIYDRDDAASMSAAYGINDILKSVTGLPLPDMKNVKDDETLPESGGVEILVGATNRAESTLRPSGRRGYGMATKGNKVLIMGGATEEKEKVAELFRRIAEQHYDGSSIRLPRDLWLEENCLPETGAYDGAYGEKMDYASGRSAADFEAHCRELEADGAVLYQQRQTGENRFVTYRKGDGYIHTYYTAYSSEIRTVTDRLSGWEYALQPSAYTKITEPCVSQTIMSYAGGSFGMGYVITLEDGSFVILDGGFGGESESEGRDVVRLYNLLKAHNRRADGKIVIAAWILTHDHPDHTTVFRQFAEKYASDVRLELLIMNPGGYTGSSYLSTGPVLEDLARFGKKVPVYIPHTGQQFYIRNAAFEVLYTEEDTYPETPNTLGENFINESSLVMRMTIGGQTVLWTADMEDIASGVLCGMYGEGLKSDIMQMAHHGYRHSATAEFYGKVDPAVVLWPAKTAWFEGWTAEEPVNQYLLNDLHVKDVLVADGAVKTLYLPYAPGGGRIVEEAISGF